MHGATWPNWWSKSVPLSFRRADPTDAPRLADLHTRSWRAAYRGQLPDTYLDGPLDAEKYAQWVEKLARARSADLILLAEQDHALAGFISVWGDDASKAVDPYGDYPGAYVDNLHVDPAGRGRGLGRALLGRAADHACATPGLAPQVWLWVLATNAPALRFYLALGGRVTDEITEPLGGITVRTQRILWSDAAALSAACRPSRD